MISQENLHRLRVWMFKRNSAKMVERDGEPYLERHYLLALARLRVLLHVFWMDDPDPLHAHPWDWGRIILHGKYREFYHDGSYKVFGPGHIVWFRDARVLHRVELITPFVVTIFWHWKRWRTWGFMYPEGWRATQEKAQDGRPLKGIILPRKIGKIPEEA